MSASSAIEWTDKTWNPTTGCDKVSAGCQHCYAIRVAYRMQCMGRPEYQGTVKKLPDGSLNWTGLVRILPERLELPLTWKKPSRIFVDSMSDLFHEDVHEKFIAKVFGIMDLARQHTYQLLTKRPGRMARLLADEDFQFHVGWFQSQAVREFALPEPASVGPWPLRNVWLGVSVEDQRTADERIPLLLQTPAAVRFLSCEPLLGPIDLFDTSEGVLRGVPVIRDGGQSHDGPSGPSEWFDNSYPGIDWVIVGGESGPNFRPMDLDWARSLRDQCQAAGVAFHFKQHGGRTHAAGGRELDGREWNQFPEVCEVARV
jgi:protein gp37